MNRSFVGCIGCILILFIADSIRASELQGNTLPQTGYIGIWADANHSVNSITPAQYATFDAWIWCQPSVNGLQAAEFAVSFPATTVILALVQQPNIAVSLGTLAGGTGVAFGEGMCQTDWVWTHHLTMMQLGTPELPAKIEIIPHPGTLPVPAYQAASCKPGYPIEPLINLTPLYINESGHPPAAVLTGASVVNPLLVQASLSSRSYDMSWTGHSLDYFFKLRNVADPTDTIRMTDADEDQLLFVLEKQMTPGTTYALEAFLCGPCSYPCAESRWEFFYAGGFEPASNLRFESLSSTIYAPAACGNVQCGFAITNNGAASCDSFDVEVARIYGWWPILVEVILSRRFGGLDAGETTADAVVIPPAYFESADFIQWFRIRVDSSDEIEEWAELDNARDFSVRTDLPHITSIVDVPADDGGEVQITFQRSHFEYRNRSVPNRYRVLRRIGHSNEWEPVATAPGTGALMYSVSAPTLLDSAGASSDYWSVYKVRLETSLGAMPGDTALRTSCPDSGYSVDNIGPTETFLQSCSATMRGTSVELDWRLSEMDPGVEFFVSRSENGADFVALDMSLLERDELVFLYSDSRVEPGTDYVYKVEYRLDGMTRLLFLSEAIETPAALLALHQNRPNPFNPSTTISFTLPVECAVRLEVYDVSGRLVARLIDGARQSAGAHDVEWNGRDAAGRAAASGIYVYRLTAGKESISRKMVLLR
jgi:hypothetical protein